MKITICGSIAFYPEMTEVAKVLESIGHEVKFPQIENKSIDGKEQAIRIHFEKIEWSDAVLVLNYDKNGIPNYIGANTLLEMGLAFYLRKPIYILNEIPEISYKEEILGMKPRVINGDFGKII
ncbi:MAG: hypothetical protein PHQ95_03240 [Candidatus Gracilibacteria bacterium]|nr:hypothetical protein [Candidatus Gracilibacteria bacterium]